MFFGEKLKSLRELNGLSRKELADKVKVSEQAIWQYENQYTAPKLEVINALKTLFSVKAQFFYTKPFVKEISKIEHIAYRSEDRDSRKKAKMETTFLNYIDYFLGEFEQRLNCPENKMQSLRDEAIHLLHVNYFNTDRKSLIEKIASLARKKLGIENNRELLYKLELSGIHILEKNMGSDIDAYSTWTDNEKAFIVLGTKKKSSVRRNFDLAHELGHLLLHYKIDMDGLSKDEYMKIEKEANDFASFFLLPEEEFRKDFSLIKKKSNPDAYIDLKAKYLVSIVALEYRAYKLGLLSFEENRYFYSSLNRKKYRKEEPLDADIPVIKPGKTRALFDMVFENRLISLNELLATYNIECSFLAQMFSFEQGFLDKYKSIPNPYYNEKKVVNLF
ncbi:transcriptional regulator [Paenibacillus larvae subsp. pulvifaciens]|uniref:Transcriptional regulator n=1 Tax=Paenibacillus larvae subsp. pulvifaciens TaxID=1477 RepID=A0A1V0UX65_9BACL|nr:XRE family transcriptional regulator [Paenibacillus larvae]ARF69785.1 transcriptional regulator [Paenibacillus larvae subsp. pulvifaciens]